MLTTCPQCGCRHEITPAQVPAKPPSQMGLTPRMQEALRFIIEYYTDSDGVSPSYTEMKQALGIASKSGVHSLVSALERRGFIKRTPHHYRSIVPVGFNRNHEAA